MNNLTYTHGYEYELFYPDGSTQIVPIFILPNEPTVQQAQSMRVVAEKTADPYLYFFSALAFNNLGMTSAAQRMMEKGSRYQKTGG